MRRLLINTAAWAGIMFTLFVGMATCASTMNGHTTYMQEGAR